jgi:hypothetical protein
MELMSSNLTLMGAWEKTSEQKKEMKENKEKWKKRGKR